MSEKILIFQTGESRGFEISPEWYEKAYEYHILNKKPYTFKVNDPENCLYFSDGGDKFSSSFGTDLSPRDITWEELYSDYLLDYLEEELNEMGIEIPDDLNKKVFLVSGDEEITKSSYNPETHHPYNYSNFLIDEYELFLTPKDRAVELFSNFGNELKTAGEPISRLWIEGVFTMFDSWQEVYVNNMVGISFLTDLFKKRGIGMQSW